ncbi:MAG: wobble nucleotide-excising tRNase [Crocinitomicaceae bacterium]
MITKIDQIKNFGIFNNFNWTGSKDIEEFNDKNIIYGWNYSGKTTLSRVFSCLRNKSTNDDYENSSFKISTDVGVFQSSNLEHFPYQVEVFNSDYVKENLSWDYDEHINAIYFEVGDNAKINKEIEEIKGKIDSINGTVDIKAKKDPFIKVIMEFEMFENSQFTTEASRIKNDVFSSLIEFNKGHLKKIAKRLGDNQDSHIIKSKEKLQELSKVVKLEEAKEALEEVFTNYNIDGLLGQSQLLLKSEPSKNAVLDILDSRRNAYKWVQGGVDLHKPNDKCLFCDNVIEKDRFKRLTSYFENEASTLKSNIDELITLIDTEQLKIKNINFPSSVNDLNAGFQEAYSLLKTKLDKDITSHIKLSGRVKTKLITKRNSKIYTPIDVSLAKNKSNSILNGIIEINNLIKANNEFSEKFDSIIKATREEYQDHLIAKFLIDNKFSIKERKHDKAMLALEKLEDEVSLHNKKIKRLTASKSSNEEGCLQFGEFVQSFLSRDDIKVKLNSSENTFNLMRGEELAKNLSEGEKMAISFAHFLVHLSSIEKKGALKDHVVFIDDPISSLDSNHIFQINSLLKEVFFDQTPDPKNPKQLMWGTKCKQIFISTHNFEFFNLLKELPKKGFKKTSHYFISRNGTESSIEKLPNVYKTFSSEYHFLFGEILSFNRVRNKGASPKLLTIPNVLRRFVEMYTLTKYPSNEEVDQRAVRVFGKEKSKRILKLLHHFSHFNSIDRIYSHADSIADIEVTCKTVVDHIKSEDSMHYEALVASLN